MKLKHTKQLSMEKEEVNEAIDIIYMKSNAQSLHTWMAQLRGHVIGHVYVLEESDGRIKMLDAWVSPDHRGRGVYRQLWDARMKFIQKNFSGRKVYAWCKSSSLHHNLNQGFEEGETVTYVEKTI